MELSYQTILEYLCSQPGEKSQVLTNEFSSSKNIMISADNFPEKISSYLGQSKQQFYRYGITKKNSNGKNISFITSLLTLLDKNFISFDKNEENTYVNLFLKQLREKLMDKNFSFELQNKFSKEILIDRIDKLSIDDGLLIQLISQIMDINFIIMNFESDVLNCVFNGDYLNPWKVCLFFAKSGNDWEPLISDKKQFSFNDTFLKNILLNEEIIYLNENHLDKSFALIDDINILESDNNLEESEDDNSPDETFINPPNEIKSLGLTKTKLKNMKKEDIIQLLTKYNINYNSGMIKSGLIDELVPYI